MEIAALFTPENGLAGAIGGAAIWILRSKALEIIANQNVQKADSEDIKERIRRFEFVLIGDEGKNGVRQQVKDLAVQMTEAKTDIGEIKNHLHNKAESDQTRLADLRQWQEQVNESLRKKSSGVRTNTGRRQADKR